ncbi:MAG: GtrA family protein [bacterium]|nr:GtrA family protein [bacterium]
MENASSIPVTPVGAGQPVASRGLKLSDTIAILVIGELFAWLLMVVRKGAELAVPQAIMYSLPIVMPLVALGCLWVMAILGRRRPTLFQLGKYAAIGFFNTALDFAIFNSLVLLTNIEPRGARAGLLTTISFTIAVINSYLWNKYWTFRSKGPARVGEFAQFVVVALVGLVLVSGFLTVMTKFIEPPYGLNIRQWANAVKVMSIFISLAWNFSGYKFIVFRTKKVV